MKNNQNYFLHGISMRLRELSVRLVIISLLISAGNITVFAGDGANITVSGMVTDQTEEPLLGVSIQVKGTSIGTFTDIDGKYTLTVPDEKSVLRFTLVGLEDKEVEVGARRLINIVLEESTQFIDEVVVVGYGTQKKTTLTGAVSSVNNKEINTTTTSNVKDMLAGKLPGVRVQQCTGEPGDYSSKMDIRGFGNPLIVIDGVIRDDDAFQRLDPNEIESVSVLKDASAAIYGVRAANGVVLVTTRRGSGDKMKIEYSGSVGFQTPSGMPDVLNAWQYAELVREADKNMGRGIDATFTLEDVERFRKEGGTDWYDVAVNKIVPQTQHNVSLSGASERMQYFLSLGYYMEEGIWKTNDLNYDRYNVRGNFGFDITKNLKLDVLVGVMTDEKKQPYTDTWQIFKSIWMLKPTETVYANNNENYMQNVTYGINPLAITDSDVSGYKNKKNTTLNSTFALTYDVPYVKGLSAKLLYAIDRMNTTKKEFQKSYTLYDYDSANDTYIPQVYNSPSNLYRSVWAYTQNQLQVSLNYEHSFGKKHNLKVLFLYEQTKQEQDNFYAKRNYEMDAVDELYAGSQEEQEGSSDSGLRSKNTNMGYIGRINYDYLSKYLAEFSFRYDGSSKFAKGHRWGFFPAGSVGYRISEESFIRDADFFSFLNNWKFRASYGVLGDDSESAYRYTSGYDYPGASYVFGDETYNGLGFRALGNDALTWYTSHTLNLGTDADMWNGLLSAQIDFFWRYRNGLLGTRSGEVSGLLGAELPTENLNSDLHKGFEIMLGHRNKINDFIYSINLNFAITRRQWRKRAEGDAVNSYDRWRNKYSNRYKDIGWSYGSSGQFTSIEDIWYSAIQDGQGGSTQLPGDWKYEDWNEDGIIDDNDVYPTTYEHINDSGNPKMTFGATIAAEWKGFDLNMLFQGGAGFNVIYYEQLQYPLCFGGNGLEHFYDRYRQDENGNWIAGAWPTTRDAGSYSLNYQRAEQTTYDASYIRLKSAEIGYTLPSKITKKAGIERARFYVNGYNLFTLSKLDFVDPEHPEGDYGYLYPIMKNFNFGVNITF